MNRSRAGVSRRALYLLTAALIGFCALPASAGSLNPKDQKQIIEVVRAQLIALAQDDAAKAFSYAAPNIRHLMGSADNFFDMVRNQYEVLYRPSATIFMRPSGEDGEAVLKVQITDEDGDAWMATYTLQRQKNRTWRITGCSISESVGSIV